MAKKYRVMITATIQRTLEVSVPDDSADPEYEADLAAQKKLEELLGTGLDDIQDCQVEEA